MRILTICLIFNLGVHVFGQEENEPRTLYGVWQEIPVVGSGWAATYHFYANKECAYLSNQMNCEDSIIGLYGTYKLKKRKIVFKFRVLKYVGGGELIPSDGSCASEYQLEGGTEMTKSIRRKEKFAYQFLSVDEDYDYLERAMIDGIVWYRMLHDPADFE